MGRDRSKEDMEKQDNPRIGQTTGIGRGDRIMLKKVILSALLAAGTTAKCGWFRGSRGLEWTGIWLCMTACLLFFYLFLEETWEKWRRRRARIALVRQIVTRLREEARNADGRLLHGQAQGRGKKV